MNVFLAGVIQGSIKEADIHPQNWRDPIRQVVTRAIPAAKMYCPYEAHPNSISYDLPTLTETLEDGIAKAAASDLVICWLPEASMGTALEMYEAARGGAVVIVITPMTANWVVRAYADVIVADLPELEAVLRGGSIDRMVALKKSARKP